MNKNNNKKNVNVTNEYQIDENGNLRLTKTGKAMRTHRMDITPEEEELVLAARRARMGQYSNKSIERQITTEGYNPSTATFASASESKNKADKLMTLGLLVQIIRSAKINFDGENIKIEFKVTSFEDLLREGIKQGKL